MFFLSRSFDFSGEFLKAPNTLPFLKHSFREMELLFFQSEVKYNREGGERISGSLYVFTFLIYDFWTETFHFLVF